MSKRVNKKRLSKIVPNYSLRYLKALLSPERGRKVKNTAQSKKIRIDLKAPVCSPFTHRPLTASNRGLFNFISALIKNQSPKIGSKSLGKSNSGGGVYATGCNKTGLTTSKNLKVATKILLNETPSRTRAVGRTHTPGAGCSPSQTPYSRSGASLKEAYLAVAEAYDNKLALETNHLLLVWLRNYYERKAEGEAF